VESWPGEAATDQCESSRDHQAKQGPSHSKYRGHSAKLLVGRQRLSRFVALLSDIRETKGWILILCEYGRQYSLTESIWYTYGSSLRSSPEDGVCIPHARSANYHPTKFHRSLQPVSNAAQQQSNNLQRYRPRVFDSGHLLILRFTRLSLQAILK